jgi:hypothetical protein
MKQEVSPRKGADRDVNGRFLPGHARSSPGRPPGVVNKITKSLREQVLAGFTDVPKFVKELASDYPPAAAGLLARMLPPAETADDVGGGGVVEINILPVRSGTFILSDDEALRHPELRRVDDKPTDAEPGHRQVPLRLVTDEPDGADPAA